jgi:hypothetical protein
VETEQEITVKINKYSFSCSDSVKNNDLLNAKIYRNKVIELLKLKKEVYVLDKEEKKTLKILITLKNNQDSKSFKKRLLKQINKQ